MFKVVLPAVMVVSLAIAPLPVLAQPAAPAASSDSLLIIRPAHLAAIGIGVVGGIIVGEALLATEMGVIVGGVLGGYLAHVWYGGRQIELVSGPAPKS